MDGSDESVQIEKFNDTNEYVWKKKIISLIPLLDIYHDIEGGAPVTYELKKPQRGER